MFTYTCVNYTANGGKSGSGIAGVAIGGAVGGVVVFLLLAVLCIVVMFVRWSRIKQAYSIDKNRINNDPSTATVTVPNTLPMTVKLDSRNYDYVKHDQIALPYVHDGVKMEYNPSYGITSSSTNEPDLNVIIQPNPSYDVVKPTRKTSEDQYGYVQPNEFVDDSSIHHHREADTVKMENNPSYGLTSSENKAILQDLDAKVKITPNPAYLSAPKSNHNKTSEYDYVHTARITIT